MAPEGVNFYLYKVRWTGPSLEATAGPCVWGGLLIRGLPQCGYSPYENYHNADHY